MLIPYLMILRSLKLVSIRSYLRETIEFPEGKVLISGDIGSGKSSLLLAIEFALFGLQRGHFSGESLLRNGKNTGTVELHLSIGKDDVIIQRKLKRQNETISQAPGFIIVNGVKEEGTAVELKSRMIELMGYPKSMVSKAKNLIFRYTVYTPQEDMKRILTDSLESRLDTLRRVFNIDKYKRIKENAQILIKAIRQESGILKAKSEDLEIKQNLAKQIDKQITISNEELAKILPTLDSASKQVEEVRSTVNKVEAQMQDAKGAASRVEELEQRLQNKVNEHGEAAASVKNSIEKIETLNKELSEISARPDAEKKLAELRIVQEKVTSYEAARKQKIDSLKREIETLEKVNPEVEKISEYKTQLTTLLIQADKVSNSVARIEELRKEQTTALSKQHNVKDAITKSKILVDSIATLKDCPTCLQKVDDAHKHKIRTVEEKKQTEAKSKLITAEKTVEQLTEHISALNLELEKQRNAEKEAAALKERLTNLEAAAKQAEKDKERLVIARKDLEELKNMKHEDRGQEILALEKEVSILNNIKLKKSQLENLMLNESNSKATLRKIKLEIGEINKEKLQLADKAKTIMALAEELSIEKTKETKAAEKEKELLMQKAAIEQKVKDYKEQAVQIGLEVDKKKEDKKHSEELKNRQNWLDEMFVNLVDVIEKQVMASVHREFSELFSDWFNMLMQDETLQVRLDDRFTPVIIQNGYEADMSQMSGGERTSLALAYRLALNRVINDLISTIKTKDLIILDEPTDGFSNQQLDNVREVLDELPNKQIIIVSHEPKVESFVDSIIRISKHEHVSNVA